jgi:hypothetical protein
LQHDGFVYAHHVRRLVGKRLGFNRVDPLVVGDGLRLDFTVRVFRFEFFISTPAVKNFPIPTPSPPFTKIEN